LFKRRDRKMVYHFLLTDEQYLTTGPYGKSYTNLCLEPEYWRGRTVAGITSVIVYPRHIAVDSGVEGRHCWVDTVIVGRNNAWNTQ